MKGYRGKPELTAAAFDADGWLNTGDIFVQDEAGYYRIVDRKKEIIVTLDRQERLAGPGREHARRGSSPLIAPSVCIGDAAPTSPR